MFNSSFYWHVQVHLASGGMAGVRESEDVNQWEDTLWANNGASDRHIHWTLELQWTEVAMLAFKSLLNINEMIMNTEKTTCTQ